MVEEKVGKWAGRSQGVSKARLSSSYFILRTVGSPGGLVSKRGILGFASIVFIKHISCARCWLKFWGSYI